MYLGRLVGVGLLECSKNATECRKCVLRNDVDLPGMAAECTAGEIVTTSIYYTIFLLIYIFKINRDYINSLKNY